MLALISRSRLTQKTASIRLNRISPRSSFCLMVILRWSQDNFLPLLKFQRQGRETFPSV